MDEISMPALLLLMSAAGDIGRARNKHMKSESDGLDGEFEFNPYVVGREGIVKDYTKTS
jgi:hypothetical protein